MNIATSTKSIFSMKKVSLFNSLMLAFAAIPFSSFAETPKIVFEENKNQWPSQVIMKADIAGGALFLERNTFTYLLKESINWHKDHRNESGGPVTQKMHCFKTHFENSNPNSEVFGNNKYSWHRNYYLGNDKSKWASNVPVFSQAYYRNLYANIDLQYYNTENNLKYDIIVHPGGDPKEIKMNYEGTDGMKLENGHLFIKTSIYDLIEQKPYAYQEINGIKNQVACNFVLKGNKVTFEVGDYDPRQPLIIDPQVIASTYSGSTADNWGFTATYDAGANIYMGGIASGTGYPTTVGSWDQTYNGGTLSDPTFGQWPFDISLTKFNPTGSTLMYSTYYGGMYSEQPHSLVVNSSNELYVVGRTNSTNFPISDGSLIGTSVAYDNSLGSAGTGSYDIIVGKFNTSGNLLASTFVGGSADDCVNVDINWNTYGTTKFSYTDDGRSEIILDANSNVYVAANTKSTDFPMVGNSYQAAMGGTQDAVVFKMNSNLSSLLWSTYLGGTGTEAAYGLKLDNSNNVYVTGGTTGANFPTTAGVLNQLYQGGLCDGFISVFNPSLIGPAQLLRSTFLGTSAYDQTYMIEIDASGDLYVFGQTQGAYPTTLGVYMNANSGQFIHKLTGNLASTIFSTTIGTGLSAGIPAVNISPTAFLVDSCQTIYIAGWGRNSLLSASMPFPSTTTGLPFTTNAFQTATDGRDHYFMVLEPDAKGLFYATYYGEVGGVDADHVDGGTCRFDKRGVIYQACCASCGGGQGFPTTPTAYSTTNNSNHVNYNPNFTWAVSNCNEAVVKMDVSVNPVAKANITGATMGCAPFTVTFSNTGSTADDFIWDFGDGGTSILPSPSYTYSYSGTYTITLFAVDSVGVCGYIDTSIVVVTVGQKPTLVMANTAILCTGGLGSATVTPTGGITPYSYAWTPSGGNSSIATGLLGNYTVTVMDSTGCATTQSLSITEPPPLTIATTTVGATCGTANGSATAIGGGGTPGYSYSWSTGQTTTSATGLTSGTYSITVTDMNGCTKTQSIIIPVTNGPTITVSSTNSVSCNTGCNGAATASLGGGTTPFTYLWSPTSAGTSQNATGLCAGSYAVIITDATGCSATGTVTIAEPSPLIIAVPSTPVFCFGGSNGTATANVSGGTPTYSYSWNTTPVQATQTASNLAAGNYSVTVTDANGCTKSWPVTITQPSSGVTVTTSTSGSSCGAWANGVATSTVTAGSGTPPYTYSWSNGGTTSEISNLLGGTYVLTVTDANGCTTTSSTTLPTSVQPVADFSYVPSITCDGISYAFTSTSTDAITYEWSVPGVGTSTSQDPTFVFPYSSTYNVTLIVTNPPCKDTLTKPIVVGDLGTGMVFKEANVFTPNNDGTNDCFHPALINIATGLPDEALIPCTFIQVFDRWGVKMFESIGANGMNCWNGRNRNDNKESPDGTYYWISKLGETTIKGFVTLSRHK